MPCFDVFTECLVGGSKESTITNGRKRLSNIEESLQTLLDDLLVRTKACEFFRREWFIGLSDFAEFECLARLENHKLTFIIGRLRCSIRV